MALSPRTGDVIVHRRAVPRSPFATLFDIGVLDHPPQCSERTYENALNQADRFAREAEVDVWYTEDGATFRAITRRRLTTC